jgi:tRNA(Arg) A34 adenosine deaminase TadA
MMTQAETDAHWMQVALTQATDAAARGEVPVGAVLVRQDTGDMLVAAGNEIVALKDPTAHAEMLVIRRAAAQVGNERLVGTTLYVTLEPCAMCAGAIAMARIPRLVFAATDPKGGAVLHGPRFFEQPTCHHRPAVETLDGAHAEAASGLLKGFFRARR